MLCSITNEIRYCHHNSANLLADKKFEERLTHIKNETRRMKECIRPEWGHHRQKTKKSPKCQEKKENRSLAGLRWPIQSSIFRISYVTFNFIKAEFPPLSEPGVQPEWPLGNCFFSGFKAWHRSPSTSHSVQWINLDNCRKEDTKEGKKNKSVVFQQFYWY